MKTARGFAILAMVVTTSVWACDSGNDTTDVQVTDPGVEADVPATEVPSDPGTTEEVGTPDPGHLDTAKENGAIDTVVEDHAPADVAPACPVVVTGTACNEVAACALQCDDAAHEAECVAQADATVKAKWEALRDCLATAACPKVFENEQFTECVTTQCAAAFEGCFSDGTAKCCAIVNCRKDCDPDDPSCPLRCFGGVPKAEQALFVEYKECVLAQECAETDVRANGWPNYTCEDFAKGQCPIQTQACFPISGCN